MENQQATTSEEQLKQQLVSKNAVDETDKLIFARYMAGIQVADKMMSKMTARAIRRSLVSAIDFGVTNSKIRFQKKEEAELAGLLANVMDVSMLIKASNLKKKEVLNGETANKDEGSVVAGTRDTSQE